MRHLVCYTLSILAFTLLLCSCESKQESYYNKGVDCESKHGPLDSKCMVLYKEAYDIDNNSNIGIKAKHKLKSFGEAVSDRAIITINQLQNAIEKQEKQEEINDLLRERIKKRLQER